MREKLSPECGYLLFILFIQVQGNGFLEAMIYAKCYDIKLIHNFSLLFIFLLLLFFHFRFAINYLKNITQQWANAKM